MTSQTPPNPKRDTVKTKVRQQPSTSHYENGQNKKKKEKMEVGGDAIQNGNTRVMMDRDDALVRNGSIQGRNMRRGSMDNGDIKRGAEGSILGSEGGGGNGVCFSDGRVWIFLVLGVLTIVFSAVLFGVYMNIKSLTSSLEDLEVLPSFIPAVAGGIAGLSVLLLFWKRRKPLVYLVLLLCFSAAVLCVIMAVLTGTRVLQPLLNARKCEYTRLVRMCQCRVSDGGTGSSSSRTKTKDSSLLTINDVAGCSVVKDILPNMLFTMVGIYGVIALVSCINGVIAILVYRIEYNRKKMQNLEYTDDYSNTPSSSNSETLLEQQTMLPPSSSSSYAHQQQPLQQVQQNHPNYQPQFPPSSPAISTTATKMFTPANAILADIYTNTNAIEESSNYNEEEEAETTSSDAVYSPSDIPVGYVEACRMRRSKSFSHPIHRSRSRETSPNSTASTSSPPPFSPSMATANSIANFITATAAENDGTSNGKGKLAPHRRRNRRAVTLHGLDRDQLMLILNLQMRYLQESDHDSKKPENFALNLTNNSTTDILMKAEENVDERTVMKAAVHDKPVTTRGNMSKSHHDVRQLKDNDDDDDLVNGVMNQVISSNLSGIKGKSRSMKCVGSLGTESLYGYCNNNNNINSNAIITDTRFNNNSNFNTGQLDQFNTCNNSIPFSQLQKRSMTPTPRQERLSSTRTSDDEWDFKPARVVRSHTPQPYHFKTNYGDTNNPNYPNFQNFYGDPQLHQHQQYYQQQLQYSLQQQQQQRLHQPQQRQIQDLQFQNMQQKMQEKLFLEQQSLMITQQQNIIQEQQRYEELQRQQQLFHHHHQQQQHQQSVNERYQQIVHEQLMKEPIISSSMYSTPLTSSSLPSTPQTIDNNTNEEDEDDDDDDEPTLITIDLRDVTKTGPLIYENVPPPRKLSHQSGITNSTSSLASSCFNAVPPSPQPKSILHNRMMPSPHNAQNPYTVYSNPQGQMARQLSQSSNLSSCSGSITMEIQKALEGSGGDSIHAPQVQPAICSLDVLEERNEMNVVKECDVTPGKIIKPKKKLSKKEKKELKEREKEIKELEKEKQKEKTQVEIVAATADPAKSSGLTRSDSDVRKSGVIPDRWQTIMTNGGAEKAPQTLWENVQKKITSETDTTENPQQSVPLPQQQSSSSPLTGNTSSPSPKKENVNNVERRDPRVKPGCLKNNYNTTPNIIFPLTYDTTKAPRPHNHSQQQQQQKQPSNNNNSVNPLTEGRQPPIGVASPGSPPPSKQPQPLPNHQINNNKSFVPVTSNSSRFPPKTFDNDGGNSHNLANDKSPRIPTTNNNSIGADPIAPPKPPRLHDRKQQQNGSLKPQGPHQVLRPKSYVNAVGGESRTGVGDGSAETSKPQPIYGNITNSPRPNQPQPNITQHPSNHATSTRNLAGQIPSNPHSQATAVRSQQNKMTMPGNINTAYQTDAYKGRPAPSNVCSNQPQQQHPLGSNRGNQQSQLSYFPPQARQNLTRQQMTTDEIPGLAACDTDLDDLPSLQHATPIRCQSLSPPPYAPPPLYKSMESIAHRERSTSSSSSEPHNTSCTLSEPNNASFASSERSYTPPIQRDVQLQRRGRGQHSLKLPNDRDHPSNRWRQTQGTAQFQVQGRHAMGRQLSLGDDANRGIHPPPSSRQLSPSHYNQSSHPSPQRTFENGNNNNNTGSGHNQNNQNVLNNSTSSCSSSSTSSSMNVFPLQQQSPQNQFLQQQQQQRQQQQQQQQLQEPYMLMRRCQSVEDGSDQPGLHRTGWMNGTGSGVGPGVGLDKGFHAVNSHTTPVIDSSLSSTNPKNFNINNIDNNNKNFMISGGNKNKKNFNNKVFNPYVRQNINPSNSNSNYGPRKDVTNSPNNAHLHHQLQTTNTPASILKSATSYNDSQPLPQPKHSASPQLQKGHHQQNFQQQQPQPQTENSFRTQNVEQSLEGRPLAFSTIPQNGYNSDKVNVPSIHMHEGENPGYAETTI